MTVRRYNRFSRGFTLIEVMLVVALIGAIATLVQINFVSGGPEEKLKQASARFAGVFDLAAEYSMLNNVELGLLVEDKQYQFVGYDGVRWSALTDNEILATHKLAEGIEISLQLEDLPIDEPQLFDAETFVVEEEDGFEKEEEKRIIPQIYILSGGDITPFSLSFHWVDNGFTDRGIYYKVTGLYTTPLTIEGPFNE